MMWRRIFLWSILSVAVLFGTARIRSGFFNPAVYDCFPFYNEIELLKMRLEELDSVVDYFVLVESAETQRGDAKPFYFAENRHLFEKYLHKIIAIAVDERHPEMGLWEREHYQRNCIARGLTACRPHDIVVISDLDEIPRPSILKEFKHHLLKRRALSKFPTALEMSIYFYHLNRQTQTKQPWGGGEWVGTVITNYKNILKRGVQHFRDKRFQLSRIRDGGWHFTWMGGKEKIRIKMCSVVEGDEKGKTVSDEEIQSWIDKHPVVPIDDTFPQYVRAHEADLKTLGFIADSN
jgi:beta-1,4-mannosyl-glycoprotein beta-1,4-N-acetylglucosaminyltransferase